MRDEGKQFCLLFVQMLGLVVDTGQLFQNIPEPSLRELGGPIQHCCIGYRGATPGFADEFPVKSRARVLSEVITDLQPCGYCWLQCMVEFSLLAGVM